MSTTSTNYLHGDRSALVRQATKRDIVSVLPIESHKVDYTLPREWVEDFHAVTGHDPRGTFVWSYRDASVFGSPRPLTVKARTALRRYNREYGAHHPTDVPVVDLG